MIKFCLVSLFLFFLFQTTAAPAVVRDCEALAQLKMANTHITAATKIIPSPEWLLPESLFTNMPWETLKSLKIPFCRVEALLGKEIRIEVWLPDDWNRKFMGVGNGAFMGSIHYPDLARAILRGYAGASTDTGHESAHLFDSDWMKGDPNRLTNFTYRAHHLMAVFSKKIIRIYYGKPPSYAYFKGCSTGGQEGLTEAQRYPDDYTGIIAGAPANNLVRLQLRGIWEAQQFRNNPNSELSVENKQLIASAAVKNCDPKDGVEDGLISDPARCGFNPAELTCKDDDERECLTPAQVKTARTLYGPVFSPVGRALYPGPAPGTSLNRAPFAPENNLDDLALFKLLPEWRGRPPLDFDFDRDLTPIENRLDPVLNSYDPLSPDLTAFRNRGGKLIIYQGWMDNGISPYNTIDYFNHVNHLNRTESIDDFLRMFMVPGMEHCRGGPGPNEFDMVTPLERWVEQGRAPDRIIAVHRTDGAVDRSRPLCVFPQRAHYKGRGDTDAAENFKCK